MARHESSDTLTIDQLLLGLTSRPNVLSTLILSRKDGSILKLSGAIATETSRNKTTAEYSPPKQIEIVNDSENANVDGTTSGSGNETSMPQFNQAAEDMAAAIHAFVKAAETLGTSSNHSRASTDNLKDHQLSDNKQVNEKSSGSENHAEGNENEIQLLRMRTKRQEIIIFPDTKFLCCVVQSTEKINR